MKRRELNLVTSYCVLGYFKYIVNFYFSKQLKKETINIDKKLYMVVSGGAGGVKIENMRIRVGIMLFTTCFIFLTL